MKSKRQEGAWAVLALTTACACSAGVGSKAEDAVGGGSGGGSLSDPLGDETASGGGGQVSDGSPSSSAGGGGALATNDGEGGVVDVMTACDPEGALRVGQSRLRRLSRAQYNNTVRDLAGAMGSPADSIAEDERVGPFHSNSRTPITDLIVQQHQEVARGLALEFLPRRGEVAGCDLESGAECVASFIQNFGLRAYRRPLSQEEQTRYQELFQLGAEQSVDSAFRLVVETILQSPFFLYHADLGVDSLPSSVPVALTSYELASRLSYFLWDSMPDEELFALAASGTLGSEEVLVAQVTRMLQDSRARDTIPLFHRQWLGLGDMSGVAKDAELFPSYGPELATAMLEELGAFADYVIREGDGSMSALFASNLSPMQDPLFSLYGVVEPANFASGDLIELDSTQRSGILTRAAFLATHAHRDQSSPVHRGMIIRENLLCQTLSPPPADVSNIPPAPTAATTTRERFDLHNASPSCANCHRLMDPIGLGFEHYDPIGAYRLKDGGFDVDASGEVIAAGDDIVGEFVGAIELSERLGASQEVADCLSNQWFRFALRRIESNEDACALRFIREGFDGSGWNIRELLTQIVLSDAFRFVRVEGSEEDQ